MNKKKTAKRTPVKQAKGLGKGGIAPPKDHQFKPGQSGNPSGPPKRRTQLWVWVCRYMAMTDGQLGKMPVSKLTQVQKTALKIVQNAANGDACGAEKLARYIIDREEGKAIEHLVIDKEQDLSDQECEQVRDMLRSAHDDQ